MFKSRFARVPTWLVACLGIMFSMVAYGVMEYVENRSIETDIRWMTQDYTAAINKEMELHIKTMQSIASFYTASTSVEREEFSKFVAGPLKERPSLHAIQWVRRVTIPARTSYEQMMKNDGFANFTIQDLNEAGRLIPAMRRGEYFPVHFIEPYGKNRSVLGLDHASQPERLEAINRARDTGVMQMTGRLPVFAATEKSENRYGSFVYYPIYENDRDVSTLENRRRNLSGFIVGVFRISDIVESTLKRFRPRGLDLFVFDASSPEDQRFLYFYPADPNKNPVTDMLSQKEIWRASRLMREESITVLQRTWRILAVPTPAFLASQKTWLPLIVFSICLFLTVLVTIYLRTLKRRAAILREINDNLETEVALRKQAESKLIKQAEVQARINEELDRANAQLQHLVTVDPLTGVLNRRGLQQVFFDTIAKMQRLDLNFYALMLDLDFFKTINDTFGYVVGDLAIKEAGRILLASVRQSDHVARIGGDEFIILLPGVREAEAMVVAQKIRFQLSRAPIGLSTGKQMHITASIGVVPIDGDSMTLDELIEKATVALHESKRRGRNAVTFHDKDCSGKDAEGDNLTQIIQILQARDQFYTLIQPILHLKDRVKVGCELLSRLRHSDFGMPDDFFRIARESKMLTLVDRSCLRTCLEASLKLEPDLKIHLNLFPSTLIETPIERLIEELAAGNGEHGHTLCVEISEQQIIGNPNHLMNSIRALKAAGIQISMDDVGFGSSCLESLILFEPDIVKIDKSCVKNLSDTPGKIRALKRLLRVIESCNADAVAEGIEREEDLAVLIENGVSYGQGFLFGKPNPYGMMIAGGTTLKPSGTDGL